MSEARPERFFLDVEQARTLSISQCVYCAHKHAGAAACNAFPGGIPDAILRNVADHRQPFPGDNGIRFSKRDDLPAMPGEEPPAVDLE